MSLKLSISVMLLRISIIKTHKIIIYTVLTILELYSVVYFFLFVLQCVPSSYFWTRYTGGSGKCMDATITVKATYAFGAVSCWVDWTLATLPFFLVWSLHMNVRTKISVACILAMGAMYIPPNPPPFPHSNKKQTVPQQRQSSACPTLRTSPTQATSSTPRPT